MKRFILIFFAILVLPILSLTIVFHQEHQYIPTPADSGFDSDYGDYDSGGWDDDYDSGYGGGYWDDDDDDYYSSSSGSSYSGGGNLGPIGSLMLIVFLIIFSIPAFIPIFINSHKEKKRKAQREKDFVNNILSQQFDMYPGYGKDQPIVTSAYFDYIDIQRAWMNRDLTPVRHLLTDEIYNMYQMQIETLIEDNQINVMSDFEFICGRIASIKATKNMETIKIHLCVNCKDYIQDTNTKAVISGDKKATITYIYELTFVRDSKSTKSINCPTCGALVKKQMSATCPYCNNLLLLTASHLTLTNKKILYQFKRN